jgi:hypothetical protein
VVGLPAIVLGHNAPWLLSSKSVRDIKSFDLNMWQMLKALISLCGKYSLPAIVLGHNAPWLLSSKCAGVIKSFYLIMWQMFITCKSPGPQCAMVAVIKELQLAAHNDGEAKEAAIEDRVPVQLPPGP